jgi:type IV secretion system protein VirD4
MSPTRFRAAVIRALAVILAVLWTAVLWLLSASALWSKGTGTPFTPLAWSDATQWWLANWWVSLWLVLAAAVPTIALAIILFGLFQFWRLRYRGQRRLRARQTVLRPVERGVTDNHGHSQWRSLSDAKKLFPGPDPVHGGIAVGEAYRVDHDQSVAGTPFDPADKSSWGTGGTAPLLIDPCTHGSGHSLIFAGPGGFKTTAAVSTALTWTGSSVILDPSTELGPMPPCAASANGWSISASPNEDIAKPPVTGFNVLAWIDITHPEAELHVRSVVSWIYDESAAAQETPGRAEDPFFGQ